MSIKLLLGDLSNGRFLKLALIEPGRRPGHVARYACQSYEDFDAAITAFLAEVGAGQIHGAAISTSGWEVDGEIDLVHFGFKLNKRRIAERLGVPRLNIVNDFVAKAMAVPVLDGQDRLLVCGHHASPDHIVAVVGPSTGLGAAYLSPQGRGGRVANHSEYGHSDLAASSALELTVQTALMNRYGHVSYEHVVSPAGLRALWQCLGAAHDEDDGADLSSDEIIARGHAGHAIALQAIRLQTEVFAGMAANFALAVGARSGVYLCGTYLNALGTLFDQEVFARRFYDKGRVASYLRDVPVYRIVAQEPEILGLAALFD